jgi:glycosyltransferase involved in cell wall biosynthesis
MKKKILYLSEWKLQKGDGISKKIKSQLVGMKKKADVDSLFINKDCLYFNGLQIIHRPIIFSTLCKYIQANRYIRQNKYDFVYVRNISGVNSIFFFILTLINNNTKFIIEIPTYPFDKEGNNLLSSVIFKNITKLYKYTINYVVYMGEKVDNIWGVNAIIKLDNAVFVDDYKLKKERAIDEYLHIIGVSSLAYWHGYDRIIESINVSKCKVVFHVVGDGPELVYLKDMTMRLGLTESVIFYGRLDGDTLDAIFDIAHIGVDSIGRHRSGIQENSSIKSKEYTARGIPFIKSHIDRVFDGCKFVKDVSSNNSIIDLKEIKEWYEGLTLTPKDIREYAVRKLQWDIQINKLPFSRNDNKP